MRLYENLSGDSGVEAYEIGARSITIRFRGGATYLYTDAATGRENVEAMKTLALAGRGLSAFVSARVGKRYAKKLG